MEYQTKYLKESKNGPLDSVITTPPSTVHSEVTGAERQPEQSFVETIWPLGTIVTE